jgi:hypothetical protein
VSFISRRNERPAIRLLVNADHFGARGSVRSSNMNRKSSFALTRNLKQGLQERQGAPIQGVDLLPLMSGSSSASRGALFNEFVPHNHLQATTSAGSCNFSTFTVAIQIERSFLAIVAKEAEFCCGPRQGN